MTHTRLHKMFTYAQFISRIPEHPPSSRHVKTHVPNAISRDGNIFSRHSMYSSLLHICRAPTPARDNTSPQNDSFTCQCVFTSPSVFEHHSMSSSIPHVCRVSPCISAEFKQRGGDAKRPGSAALLLAAPRRARPESRSGASALLQESVSSLY